MGSTGRIVTIKRSGADGPHFPLSLSSCLFGRAIECDIRIQLPVVSKQHCKIETNKQEVTLTNYSSTNPTLVNGSAIEGAVPLRHGDVITIVDRSFRYENESLQDGGRPAGPPGPRREQESTRRASRSGCSESGGSVPDPSPRASLTEGRVSGRSLVPGESVGAAGSAPEGPDPPRDHGRPTAAAGAPLGSSSESASPFRRLYESMRGELGVKPEKGHVLQDRSASGAQGLCLDAPESTCGLQAGVPAPASLTLRRKSGRRSQVKVDLACGEGGSSQAGEQEAEEGPSQHPGAPATPQSQQNSSRKRRRDGPGGLAAGPGGSPGLGPDEEAPTPRKLFAGGQTPTEAGSARCPGAALDKLPRRRSSPACVAMLRTDTGTQSPAILAPLPVQLERRVQKDPPHQPGTPRMPGLSPAGHSSFAESLSKMEGAALKRRRVSFGGRLRPELFDENLPPNTPLKRGETPTRRKSLAPPTPAVLKKIIKEQPGAPVREAAPETHLESASPAARSPGGAALGVGGPRRRSVKAAATPAAGRSPHASDAPRRGGRRSSGLSQRASLGRGRPGVLHMICSRRRSGASEANLLVAKSWADVVKLGAKQTQVRAAKPAPQRQLHKRPRKAHTPEKPAAGAMRLCQFSTGHANSPCTITIGRAHLEKVRAPARPLRMLSHLAFGRRADFSEDLSGLMEMFKTPAKEKPLAAHTGPAAEGPPGEQLPAPASGAKSLLRAAGRFGDGLAPRTPDAATGPSDGGSASPAGPERRRTEARDAGLAPTPGSSRDAAGPRRGSPRRAEEPLAAAAGTSEARRSAELRAVHTAAADPPAAGQGSGKRRRKTPLWEQTLEWETKAGERAFEACKKTVELEESPDATVAVRARASEQSWAGTDVTGLQRPRAAEPGPAPASTQSRHQTPGPARGAAVSGGRSMQRPCSSPKSGLAGTPSITRRRPGTPLGTAGQLPAARTLPGTLGAPTLAQPVPADDDQEARLLQEAPVQKLPSAGDAPGGKRRARTPRPKAPAVEDLAGLSELFRTPGPAQEAVPGDRAKILCETPRAEPVGTPVSRRRLSKTPLGKAGLGGVRPAPSTPRGTPGRTARSLQGPAGAAEAASFQEAPRQVPDSAEDVTGSKRASSTPRPKAEPLEDLAGFPELFQTPDGAQGPVVHDTTTQPPCSATQAEPDDPPPRTRQLRTALQRAADRPALGKPMGTAGAKKRLDSAGSEVGSKRAPSTPRPKAEPLEDLAGFPELFRTPVPTQDPVVHNTATRIPCRSPKPEPVGTPRRLRTPLGKVDPRPAPSTPRGTPGRTTCSLQGPAGAAEAASSPQGAPRQVPDSAADVMRSKRRPSTPRPKAEPLEDLAGFPELFRTPDGARGPASADRAPQTPRTAAQAEPVSAPAGRTRRLGTTPQRVEDLGKSTGAAGPEQTPDSAGGEVGSKRAPSMPRPKAQPLEDLAGFSELFRTPDQAQGPTVGHRSTQVPRTSAQPGLAGTPSITRRRPGTPLGTAGQLPAARTLPGTLGAPTLAQPVPADDDQEARLLQEAPVQKLPSAGDAPGGKRRARTPRPKAPAVEDLAGLSELFRTPGPAQEAVPGDRAKILCETPRAEPVGTPVSRRRLSKTPLGKAGLGGVRPAPSTPRGTPGRTARSLQGPAGAAEAASFQEAPRQVPDSAEDVTGSKRASSTPRPKAEPLEDLAGFPELFQTPDGAQGPVVHDTTTQPPCTATQAEPDDPPRRTRQLRTAPQRAADRPALGKPMGTAGAKKRLDSAGSEVGSKRAPSTPRPKAEPLEDLAGFPELFRTPVPTQDPVVHDTATRIPCRSPKPEPVGTPRRLRTPLGKVDPRPAPSTPRGTPGRTTRSLQGPAGAAEAASSPQGAPRQVPDSAADVMRSKRRPSTPRPKAEPLEDLVGFPELFRTPDGARGPASADRAPQTPRTAAQAEPVSAPAGRTRRLGTTPQRAEDLGKSTGAAGPEQTLDSAGSEVGSKRAPSTPRPKAQPLEDLAGFSELFRTPGRAQEPEAGDRAPQEPRTAAEPEGVKPSGRSRRLREPPGSVHVEAERPAPRKSTRTVRKTTGGRQEPPGHKKGVSWSKEIAERKVGDAGSPTDGKRQPRAARGKARPSEDPAGSTVLSRSTRCAREARAAAGTTPGPRTAPPPEPAAATARSRWPRAPPGRVAEEECPAPSSPTRPALAATRSRQELGAGDAGQALLQELAEREPGARAAVPGSRQPLRPSRRRARAPGAPADTPELCQGPGHTQVPVTDAKASQTPCESPEPEPVVPPSKRTRARAPPAGGQEAGPPAPRKSLRTAARGARTPSEPAGTGTGPAPARDAPPQEEARAGDPAGSRRQPRASRAKTQPLVATGQQGLQGLGRIGEDVSRSPRQAPDVRAPQRACRAPRQPPGGELAGSGDPVSSQGGEQNPQEGCRAAGRLAAKRLRPGTPPPGDAGEKPDPKKRRTAPGAADEPPQPPTAKKSQRLAGRRPVPMQDAPSSAEAQAAGPRGGDTAATGRSLRTRRLNTAGAGEPGPGHPVSADAVTPERGGKTAPRTSRETAPRHAEGEAAVHASPRSLRSGRRDKKPPLAAAEESTGEAPGEKAAADGPACRSLRPRRQTDLPAGTAKQRATRGTKRGPTEATEDDKNVSARKLRTRSRRDHKDT